MEEIWKEHPDYAGTITVSTHGRVKNKHGKLKKLILSTKGYWRASISFKKKGTMPLVSRLVAQTFIPNPENKPFVNHIDGVPTNNQVNNLEWCTPLENVHHAHSTGLVTYRYGLNHHLTKLNREQIAEIKDKLVLRDRQFGVRAFSRKFGVSNNSIIRAFKEPFEGVRHGKEEFRRDR